MRVLVMGTTLSSWMSRLRGEDMEQVITAQKMLLSYSLAAPEIEFIRHFQASCGVNFCRAIHHADHLLIRI